MIAQTAPLSQMNVQTSYVSKNNGRAMGFRRMLPTLLLNAVAPFAINMVAQHYMPAVEALLLASSVPALFTVGNLIWKKHIDIVGSLVVVGLLLSAIFALLFQSPQLLLLQSSMVSGLFGIGMLVSLFFSRPALFYIVRSVVAQNDPQRAASFDADWEFPQFRKFYRTLTIVWGCATVAQVLLHTVLVFTLPISLMLMLGPILNFAVIMPIAHWSMHYFRKNKQAFDELRKQRDLTSSF